MKITKITRKVSRDMYRTIYQYKYRNRHRLITTLHSDRRKPAITKSMIRENPNRFHNSCLVSR